MDHCPIPPGKGHVKIRNFTSQPYSTGPTGFLGYPERQGWSSDDLNSRDFTKARTTEQVRDFFQRWLFFGCAIEFLALCGIEAKHSDFITGDGQYVATHRLPQLLREWKKVAEERRESIPLSSATVIQASVILGTVRDFVDDYCIPRHGGQGMPINVRARLVRKSPLPQRVWMSVIALGHALNLAMVSGFDIRRTGSRWGGSFMLEQRILGKGWCPVDVQRTYTNYGMSVTEQYYMAKLHNTETNIHHDGCTDFECRSRNVNEATYQQSHARDCPGSCAGFQPAPLKQLTTIIRDGDIPVFKWNLESKTLELSAVKINEKGIGSPPFMAISHVWSDGLGNARDNAVYECQLEALQKGVELAATKHKMAHGKPSHFWIDTLCVPVQKENRDLRKKCIQDMKRIYECSCAVYVLSSLRSTATTDTGPARIIAREFNNWDRRLWTYQECILGRKRLIQYADKTVDHVSIEADFYRDNLWGDSESPADPIPPLSSSIASRSTSRKSDEMLCVAPLLRLDLNPYIEAEKRMRMERGLKDTDEISDVELADERMKIFWQMMGVCQWGVVFNSHRRLTADGLRWAPATFLGSPPGGFVKKVDLGYCKLDKKGRGLRFTGQAILVETTATTGGESTLGALIVTTTDPKIGKVSVEITPKDLSFPTETFTWSPGTKYVIILEKPLSLQPPGAQTPLRMPESRPDIELWLENVFQPGRVNMLSLDAVIATVKDANLKDRCQIRHECTAVAKVVESTLLDKSEAEKFVIWDGMARELLKTTLEKGTLPGSTKEIPGDSEWESASDSVESFLTDEYVGSDKLEIPPGLGDENGPSIEDLLREASKEKPRDIGDDTSDTGDDRSGNGLSLDSSGSDDGGLEETNYYDSFQPSETDEEDEDKLLQVDEDAVDSGSESADEGCFRYIGEDVEDGDSVGFRVEGMLTRKSAKWFIL